MGNPRVVERRYEDPLDLIWLVTACAVGVRVVRSDEVYASSNGEGVLVLGTRETLDPDDCLAQMIFHELCHSLVQGEALITHPDWGLDNESERDVIREHACLRLQAHLAGLHGLRSFLAPTTDFRAYYDELPTDPLADVDDEAAALARTALSRFEAPPWGPWVGRALVATESVVAAVNGALGAVAAVVDLAETDIVDETLRGSLHATFEPTLSRSRAPRSP